MGQGETRSTSANIAQPTTWLTNLMQGGTTSFAGKNVTPDTAFATSTVYAAIRVLTDAIGSVRPVLYKEDADGNRQAAKDSPVWGMLTQEPNPEMAVGEFYELLMAHLNLWGNAFIYKMRPVANGPVRELWPIDPRRVRVKRENGDRLFDIIDPTGFSTQVTTNERDILHIRAVGAAEGLYGLSPIQQARQRVGVNIAQEEFIGRLYGNDATPSGILSTPSTLGPEAAERLRANWNALHKGPGKTGNIAVLEDGVEWQSLGAPLTDLQWIESQRFGVQEIARIFHLPAWMLNESSGDSLTYSNTETAWTHFVRASLIPWITKFEQSIKRDPDIIIDPNVCVEFNLNQLLRGDQFVRYQAYELGIKAGWLKPNEVRVLENLNPIDGLDEAALPGQTRITEKVEPAQGADTIATTTTPAQDSNAADESAPQ